MSCRIGFYFTSCMVNMKQRGDMESMETFGKVFDGIKFRKGADAHVLHEPRHADEQGECGPRLFTMTHVGSRSSYVVQHRVQTVLRVSLLVHGPSSSSCHLCRLLTQIDGKEVGTVRSRALCESVQTIYMGPDPVAPDAKASFAEGIARMLTE